MAFAHVLLADLIHSRRVGDRRALERCLRGVLERLGAEADLWHAPLEAVKGIDELSSVILVPARAFDVAWEINLALWPERFRFALAEGDVDIGWETRRAGPMDGPAYHRAAAALQRARDSARPFTLGLAHVASADGDVFESLAMLHERIMHGWSPREAETVRLYHEFGQQTAVAERLGITQQAVSDALRRAAEKELRETRVALGAWLGAHARNGGPS